MPVAAPIISSNGGGATASITIAEGVTQVTTVVATDADVINDNGVDRPTVVKYKIVGGADASLFVINATTGELSFKSAPDFETPLGGTANNSNVYQVIVEANDSAEGLPVMADQQTISVTVTNVNAVTLDGTSSGESLGGVNATTEADTINGLGGADTIDGGAGADTMSGGTGNDVYIVDNAGDRANEVSGEGSSDEVKSSVTYTMLINAAQVENLKLTGTAHINGTGNALGNSIEGNSGNNIIDGGEGADTMVGGKGNDVYKVDNVGDTVTESAKGGTDRVESSVSFTLGANIENLTLLTGAANGTGNASANKITGNSSANNLDGGEGNDVLDGKGGADSMTGGAGNDKYYVDNTGDVVSESGGTGKDTVYSAVTFTLGSGVENLNLTAIGSINGTGNELNNIINGFTGNNVLDGGAGNDILDGKTGSDTMIGGNGSDKFYVNVATDVVNEGAGLTGDIDTVYSAVNYSINGGTATTGSGIENIVLTSTAATATGNALNNSLTGNSAANTLTGNDGNDVLDGKAGADTMSGGNGSDTFIVDNINDVTTESGVGNVGDVDLVKSSVTYTLGANIENLTLTGFSVANGTGNSLNNVMNGNSAKNILVGDAGNDTLDGKAGADTMFGGFGDDIYYVDNTGDVVNEAGGSGTDTINTKFTTTLGADFENLTLTGNTVIDGTGNTSNNVINGNGAANVLMGLAGNDTISAGGGSDTINGGTGQDTMTGGTGSDKFVFSTILDSSNSALTADVVTDFADEDLLDVSGIDATASSTPGVDAGFNLANSSATNLAEGTLAWSISGGVATIKLFTDTDLNTDANMVIKLTLASGQTTMDFADFIL